MPKLLKWLDDHILEYLSLALLVVLPLYPKIPIADLIPGYIVRLRADDLLVAVAFFIWFILLLRKKVTLKDNPMLIPMALYVAIGALSCLSAIFITHTVPLSSPHIMKLLLNWGRRIEYFSVFFVFLSSVKSLGQIKKYVYVAGLVLLAVSIYGFGQKYLYWPAYSTMNREFSKGVKLYLTEHARVLSTFGGHYDLAAYLMMSLTVFVPLIAIVKNWLHKILFLVISFSGFWLLILTVSRTSFLAYLISITIVFALLGAKKGLRWSAVNWFVVVFISLTIMLSFGDLSERFAHILKLDKVKSAITFRPFKKAPPQDSTAAYLDIGSKSDIPPSSEKPTSVTQAVPSDVYSNIPENNSTNAAVAATLAAKPRVYSQAAVQYDLSTGIRLDYTWPQAIKGFLRNPLFGSGYSTLTKKNIEDFTEAESTDNDFLRALGETGLLGFLSFFGAIAFICYFGITNLKKIDDPFYATVVAGLTAATIGLLVNAVYIDVFEASKVAYAFWIGTAIMFATVKLAAQSKTKKA
ncbi:MAG TPA: O-antigen ligase family protein [Candidatus Saccharimonadales bacterium]|nr:O-antigen ligase family protein [Candidatus Saccharimonadales bacterium]